MKIVVTIHSSVPFPGRPFPTRGPAESPAVATARSDLGQQFRPQFPCPRDIRPRLRADSRATTLVRESRGVIHLRIHAHANRCGPRATARPESHRELDSYPRAALAA